VREGWGKSDCDVFTHVMTFDSINSVAKNPRKREYSVLSVMISVSRARYLSEWCGVMEFHQYRVLPRGLEKHTRTK
jgi:hypothetical protein